MLTASLISVFSSGNLLQGCATMPQTRKGQPADPLSAIVHFYRGPLNHLSAVRGGTCPMYPCSSSYSLECLQKHGLLAGWVMTCDRLLRSGRDELYLAPEIVINGKSFSYDPVEANDFWWHQQPTPLKVDASEDNLPDATRGQPATVFSNE